MRPDDIAELEAEREARQSEFGADKPNRSPLRPLTERQADYISSIQSNTLTFGVGPAGTGKTWCAACLAADTLSEGGRVIITRPAMEAGESLGFLPGLLEEKFDPYFAPVRSILERRLGAGQVKGMIRSGRLKALPLALMRGHSFEDTFVLLDEAQNTTPWQMKMLLTRIGEGSCVVVDGDLRQSDLGARNGLLDALDRLKGRESVGVIRFGETDIVRSGFVQMVVNAYENDPH